MNNISMKFSIACYVFLLLLANSFSVDVNVVDLRCEYLKNPLGIDVVNPRLSWRVETTKERSVKQKSYRIQMASSLESLEQGKADLWDSGEIKSDESVHIEYASSVTKRQHSRYATARNLACPSPAGTLTTELARVRSTLSRVGYDYMSARLTHDQTFTGRTFSIMGCTQEF